MNIEIKPEEKIKVKHGDQVFEVSQLKVGFVRKFRKRLEEAGKEGSEEDGIDVMVDFCIQCGVPESVVDDWSMPQMAQFFKEMSSGEQEKKV